MTPNFSSNKYVQTSVSLEVHKALHNNALDLGVSLADLLRVILENYVSNKPTKEVTQHGSEET